MSDLVHIVTPETARRLSNRLIKENLDNTAAELRLTYERDAAEDAFIKAFALVVGHEPPFSKSYGFEEALQDLEECLCPSLRLVE